MILCFIFIITISCFEYFEIGEYLDISFNDLSSFW